MSKEVEKTLLEREKEYDGVFRKKSQHHQFLGFLFNAIANATFIGLMGALVMTAVNLVDGLGGTGGAAEAATNTANMMGPFGVAAAGGMMAVGASFSYLAVQQFTELKCIQDERLAHKNFIQKELDTAQKAQEKAEAKEHEHDLELEEKLMHPDDHAQFLRLLQPDGGICRSKAAALLFHLSAQETDEHIRSTAWQPTVQTS